MAIKDFLQEIDGAVSTVLASSFQIEVVDTRVVPSFGDSDLTYDNFDGKTKKCKRLESCVLYVDIRNSASISSDTHAPGLARLYSVFVRSMTKAARYYGGHVRNIIGDRVMVVFDQDNCFKNAVNTAVLMNTISARIINERYAGHFVCGIGIDYGKMLVTKAGEVRRGTETEFYRSFVWLGQPANIASRLTDLAGKNLSEVQEKVHVAFERDADSEWEWHDQDAKEFVKDLESEYPVKLAHKDSDFVSFFLDSTYYSNLLPTILVTKAVLDGFKLQAPQDLSVINNWWAKQRLDIKEYKGEIYGADLRLTAANEI